MHICYITMHKHYRLPQFFVEVVDSTHGFYSQADPWMVQASCNQTSTKQK